MKKGDPSREPVVSAAVRRIGKARPGAPKTEWLATEAPLEVRLGGLPFTVLMRTPGEDEELVRGFLFNEGLITTAAEIASITAVSGGAPAHAGRIVEVVLASRRQVSGNRSFFSSASCGVCGKQTIASLEVRGALSTSTVTVARRVLGGLAAKLRDAQSSFERTGGVHASGLFSAAGKLMAIREDIGRHNALDKLIGWALAAGRVPLTDTVLLLSGRVSYELVQKSIAASVPVIAAVGAPSSLAVDLAERFGITLVGFLRPESMNVYTHGERVTS